MNNCSICLKPCLDKICKECENKKMENILEHISHVLVDLKSIHECNQHTLERVFKIQKNLDKRIKMLTDRVDRMAVKL